jgi:hypothetical protein
MQEPSSSLDPALQLRLEASRVAQERTRLAFFAATIIALMMVTGAWNPYLSFYRDVAYDFSNLAEAEPKTEVEPKGNNRQGTQTLQKELLAAWLRNRMINVSVLGINVGVDDASTVGAVALIIALIWFYFVIRRENHTIGRLLIDYRDSPKPIRWLIFHGINSYTVFSNVGQSDEPIGSITVQPQEHQVPPLRFLSHYLYFLPFVGLSFIIILEIHSLFRVSPFRPPFDKWVITILWEHQQQQCEFFGELFWVILWRLLAIVLAIPVFRLCRRISRFDYATEFALRQFVGELMREPPVGGSQEANRGHTC